MAALYEARHVLLGTRAAVKRMLAGHAAGDVSLERFRKEAVAALRIRHPNVIRIYDYGVDATGVPYLAMELLEGTTLSATLAVGGPLGVHDAADLFLPLLAGVAAVHAAGVVHRDVKPHNIVLRRRPGAAPEPVLIDLGVAKLLDSGGQDPPTRAVTSSGVPVGTAAYMAPEQILGDESVDPAADQYALGVTLYECLTGRAPFTGDSVYEQMHAALNDPLAPPSALRPGIPAEVDAIVLRAMAREPGDRFPSVPAMGEALLPFASDGAALAWHADALAGRRDATASSVIPVSISGTEATSREAETMAPWGPSGVANRPQRKSLVATLVALVTGALAVVAVEHLVPQGDGSRTEAASSSAPPAIVASASMAEVDEPVLAPSALPVGPPSASAAPGAVPAPVRRAPRPAVRPSPHPSASSLAPVASPAAASGLSCDPPYFFDPRGNRVFKPDCL